MPSKPISEFEVVIKQEAVDTMFLAGVDLDFNVPKELQNIRIRLNELFPGGVNLTSSVSLDLDEPHTREGIFSGITNKNTLNFKSLRSRDGFIVLSSDPDEVYIDVDWGKCTPTDVHDGKEGYIILRGQSAPDYYFPASATTDYIAYYNPDTQMISYGPASDISSGGGGGTTYTAGLGLELNSAEFKLNHLGIQNLVDPGSHAFIGWNTGTQATQWYTLGDGISIVNNQVTINLPGITGQFAPGSVIFAGVNGQLHEDNDAFFWDDTNDYLGRRTTSPQAPLHFVHSNQATPSSTLAVRLPMAIWEKASGTEDEAWISVLSGDTGEGGITFGDDDHHAAAAIGYSNQSKSLSFYVEGSSAASERIMYIDSTGVGISKGASPAIPTQALDVYDNARFRGLIYDSANGAGSNGQVLTIVNGFPVWAAVPGVGGSGTNFSITDGSNSQAVGDAEAITFAAGTGLDVLVSATRTVTYSLDAVLTDLTDVAAPPGSGNYILQATNGANYSWIATPGGGSTTLAFAVDVGTTQVMDLGDTITISGGNKITTTTTGVTDEVIINWLADIDDLSDVPSYGSGSTALVLTAQNGSLTWAASGATYTGFTFSSTGNGTAGSETINSGDNMEFVFGAGLSGVFGGTTSNPELALSLKNSGNFTAGFIPRWDSINSQYTNSIISENVSVITVDGYLVVNDEITINDGNKLRLWNAAGTFNTTLQASASTSATVAYKLPTADGTAAQVLSTDGSGNMYWATVSGGGGVANVYNKLSVSGSSTNNLLVTATGEDGIEFNSSSLVGLSLVQGAGTANDVITISWAHLGIENLADPGADRIAFFDDSTNGVNWLNLGTGLSISGTTLNVSAVAQDIFDTVQADSGTALLSSASSTLTIAGGTNVSTALSGSTLTIDFTHVGDDLGNHTATEKLKMSTYAISYADGSANGLLFNASGNAHIGTQASAFYSGTLNVTGNANIRNILTLEGEAGASILLMTGHSGAANNIQLYTSYANGANGNLTNSPLVTLNDYVVGGSLGVIGEITGNSLEVSQGITTGQGSMTGTAQWKFGVAGSSPIGTANRYLEVEIGGTVYRVLAYTI